MRRGLVIYPAISCIVFLILLLPFFFLAGAVQDEGYIFKKCWVSYFLSGPIFSDEGCGESTAVRRKIVGKIYSISQDLPPQYSLEIYGVLVPFHSWLHVGPLPYVVQDFFIFLGDKIDGLFGNSGIIRFYFSKVPSFLFGFLTLIFIQKSILYLCSGSFLPLFFSSIFISTFFAFVYNSSIGIAIAYISAVSFISLSLYFLVRLVKEEGLFSSLPFIFSSSLAIWSYLPSWVVVVSLVFGLRPRKFWRFMGVLCSSLLLGFFPYVISSFDILTNPQTPPPWMGLLPRDALSSFLFVKNRSIDFSDRLKDFLNFFGYRGSGQSFIIKEKYGWNLISLPSLILILLWGFWAFRFREFSSKVFLSFVVFIFLQFLLFPFPNHPRSFLLFFPPMSLGIFLFCDEVLGTGKRKDFGIFSLLFLVSHFFVQLNFYFKGLSDLIVDGSFHISVRYDFQRDAVEIIKKYRCENFINISGYFNFPILAGKNCVVEDYIYFLNPKFIYYDDREIYRKDLEKILIYHKGKIFIVRDIEEEKIIDELSQKNKIKIVKKDYIPLENPKYIFIYTE